MAKRSENVKKARSFWCDQGHKRVSAMTKIKSPKCPICGGVMTFGKSTARRVRAKR